MVLTLAKENKAELLSVIDHFKNEELKLRATYFLIENMIDQYHYEGEGIVKYRKVFTRMDSLLKSGNGIFDASWDSIQTIYPAPPVSSVEMVRDAESLKASFLIKHIESAFTAWNYPWAKHLTFDEFCEYILPYKVLNEEPEEWMGYLQNKYKWIADSIKEDATSLKACKLINKDLKQWFYINARFECNWDPDLSDLNKVHTGKCSHAAQLAAYSMRAMGVPVAMDFTPHWANKNLGHEWNALLVKDKVLHFIGSETDPGCDKIVFTRSYMLRRKRAKVYRRTYAVQRSSLAVEAISMDDIPDIFRNRHIKDVTDEYMPVSDVTIKVNDKMNGCKFVYLCVFNDQTWKPISWAKIGTFSNATFEKMGRDILYLPMYYKNGRLIAAHAPVILNKEGTLETIEPNVSAKTVVNIRQKYPEDKSNDIFRNENYELYYWNTSWKSLGKQKASVDSLVYKNVPANALLWVRNLDKGKQERVFMYKEGKQIWW